MTWAWKAQKFYRNGNIMIYFSTIIIIIIIIIILYLCIFIFFLFQMDQLNAIGRNQFQPARPITQMEIGKSYKVLRMRKVDTRHGSAVIVLLYGFGETFLPGRVSKALHANHELYKNLIDQIGQERLTMTFLGGQFNAIEFA